MIGRLNHVAIAVPDLSAATAIYRDTLGAQVSPPQEVAEHGVTVVFVNLPNTKIELLHPLGENSPIAAFLAKKHFWRHPSRLLRSQGYPRRPRSVSKKRRPRSGRRRAQNRCAR